MFFLNKPSPDWIRAFLSPAGNRQFSYPHVGASQKLPPSGYIVDHYRVQLGAGHEVFYRAVNAVRQWKMFDMPWVELCWPNASIEEGTAVAVLLSHLGFWSLNPCRIVYVIQEHQECEKFGFAYGTLLGHEEQGEERFTVEFHSGDQSVWYDLYAFSRPNFMACLGYPLARTLQKRFARDSKTAMQRAVTEPTGG